MYSFHKAAETAYYKPSGLKQHTFIPARFRRPEVQNQGVGMAVLPLMVPASSWSQLDAGGPWLKAASLQFPPPSPLGFRPCVFLFSSYEDTRPIGLGALTTPV